MDARSAERDALTSRIGMMQGLVEANTAAVEAHFHSEASNEVEEALEYFTDRARRRYSFKRR